MKIAIDIGNGYIKAISEGGQQIHFPSVIKENYDNNIMGVSKNDYAIKINNKDYYIGNLALAKKGTRTWHTEKAINENTLNYIALCLALLVTDEEDSNPHKIDLCLGLPYSYFISLNRGKELIDSVTNTTINTVYKDCANSFKICNVSVYPQGVGAYFNNLYTPSGDGKPGAEKYLKSLFIDIGYRTVDVVAFENLNGKFELIEENSFSLEENGIFKAINRIAALVGNNTNANDVEYALQNNNAIISNMYGDIDLKESEKQALSELASEIANHINIKLSGDLQRYPYIFLTGGGASKLLPHLKRYYTNIRLQEDNIFCNAKGYLALRNTKR